MKKTLLIMAAGMGSRYGGNKQVDQMGPKGQMLMEYSLYDAIEAGFNKVVFVIREHMKELFDGIVGDELKSLIEVRYAYQEFDSLPSTFTPPDGRKKPYGTVHAVLSARGEISEPFAVINADDYYGKSAFKYMSNALEKLKEKNEALMIGYRLKNTVSPHGHVTRGVCKINHRELLEQVIETYEIIEKTDGSIWDLNTNTKQDPTALVSMNFWGFTPWTFDIGKEYLTRFLSDLSAIDMKSEYPLPVMVDDIMADNGLEVRVIPTDSVWFGVTYKEDKPIVEQKLLNLHKAQDYPDSWTGYFKK